MVSLPFIWKPSLPHTCVIFVPAAAVEFNSGLFGDLVGNLERLRPEEHDALAVVIEWPDLDSRLGLRTLGWLAG